MKVIGGLAESLIDMEGVSDLVSEAAEANGNWSSYQVMPLDTKMLYVYRLYTLWPFC